VLVRADYRCARAGEWPTGRHRRDVDRRHHGADGRFSLRRAGGARTLRIRLSGYRATDRALRAVGGDTVRVEVVLERSVQLLSPCAPMRGASRRVVPDEAEHLDARPSRAGDGRVPKLGEPDVVRVVQLMPGVVARNDFIRG
jgi:hypothetical protein